MTRNGLHTAAVAGFVLFAVGGLSQPGLAAASNVWSSAGRDFLRLKSELKDENNNSAVITGCRGIILDNPSFIKTYYLMASAAAASGKKAGSTAELDAMEEFLVGLASKDEKNPYYAWGLGTCQRVRGNYLKAMEHFERSLRLGLDARDAYVQLIDYCQYKEDLFKVRSILEGRPLAGPSADMQSALGIIAFRLSEFNLARSKWNRALAIYRKADDVKGQGWALGRLSEVSFYQNEYGTALKFGAESLRALRSVSDTEDEIDTIYIIAFVHLSQGDYPQAMKLAQQARALCNRIGDPDRLHIVHYAEASCFLEQGALQKAQDLLNSSYEYFGDKNELFKQMRSLYWITLVQIEKGEYIKALASGRQGLEFSRQLGFPTSEIFSLSSLADVSLALGNDAKSLEYSREALALSGGKIGKWSDEKCLNTIGYVLIKKNRNREALGHFLQALDFIRRIELGREEPKCLYNVGYAYLKMGEAKAAGQYLEESIALASRQGNRIIQALCCNGLAELALEQGQAERALELNSRALRFGMEMDHSAISIEAYTGLGMAHEQKGSLEAALTNYKLAVGLIEDIRNNLRFREYSTGFFKDRINVYERLIDLNARLNEDHPGRGYDGECFYYAEKARTRAFLDDMQAAEVKPQTDGAARAIQYEIDILSHRVSKIITMLYSTDLEDGQRVSLRADLSSAEEDLQTAWADYARLSGPSSEGNQLGPTSRAEDVRRSLLDDKTALIEYFLGDKTAFMFLVTKKGLVIRRTPAASFQATLSQAENYRSLLSMKDETGFAGREAGAVLYRSLFKPLKDVLPMGVTKIIIVPDGELFSFPFETLVCGENGGRPRFLLEDYQLSYSPSASVLIRIKSMIPIPGAKMDLLAVGNPVFGPSTGGGARLDQGTVVRDYYLNERFELYPLKFAQDEIMGISRLFSRARTRVITGADATEDAVKASSLSAYRIIHFATHGLLDEYVSSRSALVLTLDDDPAEDGFFQAREIYDLKLDADLVVLSACQTARGVIEKGEGLSGLARAFFCAGARSVLASLWDVNDRSTGPFMKEFYGYLVKGQSKEESLRQAKLKMLDSRYSHPYYWAPFILIGESESSVPCEAPSLKDRILGAFQ